MVLRWYSYQIKICPAVLIRIRVSHTCKGKTGLEVGLGPSGVSGMWDEVANTAGFWSSHYGLQYG